MNDLNHLSVQARRSIAMNDENTISCSEVQGAIQQQNLDSMTTSTRSSSCSGRHEQQDTSDEGDSSYNFLYRKWQSHDREIEALKVQLSEVNEKIQPREETSKKAFAFRPLGAAFLQWLAEKIPENNIGHMASPEIYTKLPNQDSHPEETTEIQGNEEEEEEEGAGDIMHSTAVQQREPPQRPAANFANDQKIDTDSAATGTYLESENAVLRASLSDLEQSCANYRSDLETLGVHRCANGDELDVLDSELEQSFVGLKTRIEDLFEHCLAGNINFDTIKEMSEMCNATALPTWWNFVQDEGKRVFWLRGLLANALHAEFFGEEFFFDADRDGRFKAGFVDFEKMLIQENSGVDKSQVAEWRARTFRLTELMARKQGRSPSARVREVADKLKILFKHDFDTDPQNLSEETKEAAPGESVDQERTSNPTPSSHLDALQGICEQALHCSVLLRSSTSAYTWDQRDTPPVTVEDPRKRRTNRIKINATLVKSKHDAIPPFNIFGEVLRLRRTPGMEPVQILMPTVVLFGIQ